MKAFIEHLARQAGRMAVHYRTQPDLDIQRKEDPKDIVTRADREIEHFLRSEIEQHYPNHGVIGEEEADKPGVEYCWVIDPIDGTASYAHGQYHYAISIALQKNNETILGAVYAPALDELFMAEAGKGATRNRRPIHVSSCARLEESMLGTGFACLRNNRPRNNLPLFAAIAPKVRDTRRFGSAALDLAYVACGQLDGFWELHLHLYDIAAGVLLVREAGGLVTDFRGDAAGLPGEILATNGALHSPLLRIIREAEPANPKGEP